MAHIYTFSATIASRGYHIYMHTIWQNAFVGERVIVQPETNIESKMLDPYCCAVKIKDGHVWSTVGHIPREISRYVYFFLHAEGGNIDGTLQSYRPSPIPAGGLEVPLNLNFHCRKFCIHEKAIGFISQYDYKDGIKYLEEDESEDDVVVTIDSDDSVSEDDSQIPAISSNKISFSSDDSSSSSGSCKSSCSVSTSSSSDNDSDSEPEHPLQKRRRITIYDTESDDNDSVSDKNH